MLFLQACEGHQFKYVAHPLKENYYVLCVPGYALERTCGYGSCFNEDDVSYPCSKNCKSTTPAADSAIKKHCVSMQTDPLDRVYIENDCNSFYVCMGRDKEPLHVKCPPHQYFAVDYKMCVDNTEGTCKPVSKWCEDKNDGTRVPLSSCHMYYECTKNKALIKICEYGFFFDMKLKKCVKGICEQDNRKPTCKLSSRVLRYPHKKCNKFYQCSGKIPIEKQCPTGGIFDHIRRTCVEDVKKDCKV